MKGKVAIYYGQNVEFSKDVISIISFNNNLINEKNRKIIFINKEKNYFRNYLNFKNSLEIWNPLIIKYFKHRKKN